MTELEELQKQLNDIREAMQRLVPGSRAHQKLSEEQAALEAQLTGAGATAIGEDGIGVGGNLDGTLIKGEQNQVFRNSTVILAGDGARILVGEHATEQNSKPNAQVAANYAPTVTSILTFLFTDIAGSTQLWEKYPEAMKVALARHDDILRGAIESHKGKVFKTVGDAFYAVFPNARNALKAALAAQQALHAEAWGETVIKVRMAIHTGSVEMRDNDYFGPPLNRVARLMSAGHGGQVLLSATFAELLRANLPEGVELRDMGERSLKDLIRPEHIYQLTAPGLQTDFPPLKTLEVFRSNLPVQMTSFIGREKEIAAVKSLMAEQRLVSLIGSGGTGKTRLSLQVAANLQDSFAGGVWFVELAPLNDPALITQTIANTFGLREEANRPLLNILTDYLQQKNALLILDNCEHIVDAAAQLTKTLLQSCTNLRILVSSREALGIAGEAAYHVPSLGVPSGGLAQSAESILQYEAPRLFVERARTIAPAFAASDENAPAIAHLCTRLDGIPLAIELAAARVKMLTVQQIAERLDDRFRLLTGGSRTALPRQQTLRAMIDWSYGLLTENERVLLRFLAVFTGGWTLELAEQICANEAIDMYEVLDLLGRLVDKSLVVAADNYTGEETRYRMLETIRQYAREKLFESGEGEKVRDQHLNIFIQLAETAEPEIRSANQMIWLNRLSDEVENLHAALEWAQERNPESFLRLASPLWRFWMIRGHEADQEWLPKALAQTEDLQTVMRARALGRAVFTMDAGATIHPLKTWLEEAETLSRSLDDKLGLAMVLVEQCRFETDHAQSLALLDQSLALAIEMNDAWLKGFTHSSRAMSFLDRNDLTSAYFFLEQALKDQRKAGDQRAISTTLSRFAFIALAQGDLAQFEKLEQEALEIAQMIGDESSIVFYQAHIAVAKAYNEDYTSAKEIIHKNFVLSEKSKTFMAETLLNSAFIDLMQENLSGALEQLEAGLALARQIANRYLIAETTAMFGEISRKKADFVQAAMYYNEALNIYRKENWLGGVCYSLDGAWMLAIDKGQTIKGVRLWGARETLRASVFLTDHFPHQIREREAHLAKAHQLLDEATFAAAQAAGRAMSMDEAIALALDSTNE